MALDDKAVLDVKKAVKAHLGVLPGEDFVICLKFHDDQKTLVGYCQKDKGQSHFKLSTSGWTRQYLEECYSGYQDRLRSPLRNKKSLHYSNALQETYLVYKQHVYPLPPPSLNTMLTYMINGGEHIPSAVWATSKDFDMVKAETLWQMLVHSERAQPGDTARVFFGAAAPRDPLYDCRSFADVKRDAQARRDELLDENPDVDIDELMAMQPWRIDTAPEGPHTDDVMALHTFGTPVRPRILSQSGIAGGLVPPILSPQTTGILRRRDAMSVFADAMAGLAGPTGSSCHHALLAEPDDEDVAGDGRYEGNDDAKDGGFDGRFDGNGDANDGGYDGKDGGTAAERAHV